MCVLRLPARGGGQGTDPEFAIWEEKGGVDLCCRTLEHLGFEPTMYSVSHGAGKLSAMAELVCIKTKDGKEFEDPAPDRKDEEQQGKARVKRYDGYWKHPAKPVDAGSGELDATADLALFEKEQHDVVFLNDAGQSTRDDPKLAKAVTNIDPENVKLLLHKMHHPLSLTTDLAKATSGKEQIQKVLIVTAFDLRLAGIRMRGHLSWDAALEDLGAALDDKGGFLNNAIEHFERVIVVFGVDAVACVHGRTRISFVYHPTSAEGDLFVSRPGGLYGQMNAFSCAFLAALRKLAEASDTNEENVLEQVLLLALAGARAFADSDIILPPWGQLHESLTWPEVGISTDPKSAAPIEKARTKQLESLQAVTLGLEQLQSHESGGFRLISLWPKDTLELSHEIIKSGKSKLLQLPSARIGKFTTLDRSEIESYRTLQRLIDRYLADTRITKPISIGVFGPPGSGKSFGIKQIAKLRNLPMLEFNLSEADADALPGYFHEVRDRYLEGETPLCFFDEFDSRERALVARFLAPMQDGSFRDGPRVHPVGRAIFVFAGGTAESAAEFLGAQPKAQAQQSAAEAEAHAENIRKKVPDFVSRLSATLDIMGPNPMKSHGDGDSFYLRRAVLMRSMLEQHLPQIVADGDSDADVSPEVSSAFLTAERYLFGARSIEQVLRMCAVPTSQTQLGLSDLPDKDRLSQHIAAPETFVRGAHNAR